MEIELGTIGKRTYKAVVDGTTWVCKGSGKGSLPKELDGDFSLDGLRNAFKMFKIKKHQYERRHYVDNEPA